MRMYSVLFSVLFAACAFGQVRSVGGGSVAAGHTSSGHVAVGHAPMVHSGSPSGNVVFPGTGGSPAPGSVLNPGFGPRQPTVGIVQGRGPGYGNGAIRRGNTVVIPYGYPVAVGGYGSDSGYSNGYAAQPQEQQQYSEPPTVIINQTFVPDSLRPTVRDYSEGSLPESPAQMRSLDGPMPHGENPSPAAGSRNVPDPKGTIYLIAYRDGSVYQAVGYWFEGDTLNYVTPRGNINRATMDLIDKDLSEQLNRERNVEFSLRK